MDSESAQDDFYSLEDGEKDLMTYEEEEILAFEESEDSTMDDRSVVMTPGSHAATTNEDNFSLLMSASDAFTSPGHSLLGYEPEEVPPVCAPTPQPEELEAMDTFETLGETYQEGAELLCYPMSPCAYQEVEDVPGTHQIEDLESEDYTTTVFDQPSPPPKEKPDAGHQLHLFHTDQMLIHAISIREISDTSESWNDDRAAPEPLDFNGIDFACQLLKAAAAQMELKVIVSEATVMAIANGLHLSMGYQTEVGNPLAMHRAIGRMVADLLLDIQTGIVRGFAVARLVPHPVVNSSGVLQGTVLHQVTRGFAIDDSSRRIITEAVSSAIMLVNQNSNEQLILIPKNTDA